MSQQNFRMPEWFFYMLSYKFGPFIIDAAANKTDRLCLRYYDKEIDGLKAPWIDPTFCNPPWRQFKHWVKKAYVEFTTRGVKSVLVGPVACSQRWANEYIRYYATIYIPDARIHYREPDGMPTTQSRVDTNVFTFGYYRPPGAEWVARGLPVRELLEKRAIYGNRRK